MPRPRKPKKKSAPAQHCWYTKDGNLAIAVHMAGTEPIITYYLTRDEVDPVDRERCAAWYLQFRKDLDHGWSYYEVWGGIPPNGY